MYSMKEVCQHSGLSYQTLKFYCNEGLIPNVRRDENNYRIFDENDLSWITGITCLKQCDFSIKEIKEYLNFCLQGKKSIPARLLMLSKHKSDLLHKAEELNESLAFIDKKVKLYNDFLEGTVEYYGVIVSNTDTLMDKK